MCIAIVRLPNIVLTKQILKNCFNQNPDGGGFAYPSDNRKRIVIENGFFGFRKFWQAYRKISNEKPMLIHFRIATSGKVDAENSHPWRLDNSHAFVHNGNLEHKLDEKSETLSDTGIFVKRILSPLFKDKKYKNTKFWATQEFKWLIEESIGYSNKMAILSSDGTVAIFRETQGEWKNGAWFSNNTYKEDRKTIRGTKVVTVNTGTHEKEITTSASGRTSIKYKEIKNIKTKKETTGKILEEEQAKDEFQQMLSDNPEINIAFMY